MLQGEVGQDGRAWPWEDGPHDTCGSAFCPPPVLSTIVMSGLRVTFGDSSPWDRAVPQELQGSLGPGPPTLVGWCGRLVRMPLGPPGTLGTLGPAPTADWALLLVRGAGQMTGPHSSAAGDCVPSRSAAATGLPPKRLALMPNCWFPACHHSKEERENLLHFIWGRR